MNGLPDRRKGKYGNKDRNRWKEDRYAADGTYCLAYGFGDDPFLY